MIGTPRNVFIGGWFGGKPTTRGSSLRSWRRNGRRVADQRAEDPRPCGQVADRACASRVDAGRDEALEPVAAPVDHAERRVTRAGELHRDLDDSLEQRVERQLRIDTDERFQQCAQPDFTWAHGFHARKRSCGARRSLGGCRGAPVPGASRGRRARDDPRARRRPWKRCPAGPRRAAHGCGSRERSGRRAGPGRTR